MMNSTRRDFTRLAFTGAAALTRLPGLAASGGAERGVKLGITTGSLNPPPDFPGKDRLDTIVEECSQLGCRNVELAAGFFGPGLRGAAVGGQVPKEITLEYQKSREQLRAWRMSAAAVDRAREVRKKFDDAGINLFSMSNTFADDVTDPEIDALFRQMRALWIHLFQTNLKMPWHKWELQTTSAGWIVRPSRYRGGYRSDRFNKPPASGMHL